MKFIIAFLALAVSHAQFMPMGGMGMGAMGGMGMGAMGMGGMGFLCGHELSDEELEELCFGCCSPEGCCYELCGGCGCGMGGLGGCGGFGGCGNGFGGCGNGFSGCGNGFGGFGNGCGFNGMGGGFNGYNGYNGMGGCQVARPYYAGSSMNNGAISGYGNGNCANTYGSGARNCGYNNGNICGSAGRGGLSANSCRAAGNRAFANKCADEFLVRRCNDACATGNDCYDSSRANMCAGGAKIAGNRNCGNANTCYNNAAGLNCNSHGIAGRNGCCRNTVAGCGSPCAC